MPNVESFDLSAYILRNSGFAPDGRFDFYLGVNTHKIPENRSHILVFPRLGLLSMVHHRIEPKSLTFHQTLTFYMHPTQSAG